MKEVFAVSGHTINALGADTESVWQKMLDGQTGVQLHNDAALFAEPFWAALTETALLESECAGLSLNGPYTRFEKLCLLSASRALSGSGVDPSSPETLFILSTTKGNIDLLESNRQNEYEPERNNIWYTARLISDYFQNPNCPLIICNACISGVLALITARDYLNAGLYRHAVVIGADIASEFVISGFQSFKSLASGPCKPFDAERDGLNLGEGAGTLVLSVDSSLCKDGNRFILRGGATSNDANHISGPSRDGEGLYLAVMHTLKNCGIQAHEVDFISAHGTATPFNDEMESKAFARAGLGNAPLNSMKGYFGHTLGAAGVIETIIALHSMKKNVLLKTLGFAVYGVPEKISVLSQNTEAPARCCIKTASGFGGCNAALAIEKQ